MIIGAIDLRIGSTSSGQTVCSQLKQYITLRCSVKIGDLVRIKHRGYECSGTLAIVAKADPHRDGVIHVFRKDGKLHGYYRRDLEKING